MDLPFASDTSLRGKYVNTFGQLRLGRLLEDMDAFAGSIAYRYCEMPDEPERAPPLLVTASCDAVDVFAPLPPIDMQLRGAVTYVGSSSMNIELELVVPEAKHEEVPSMQLLARSAFTFVARNPDTGKAMPVPWLHPRTREERAWYAAGRQRQEQLKAKRVSSVRVRAPSSQQLATIHALFAQRHGAQVLAGQSGGSSAGQGLAGQLPALAPSDADMITNPVPVPTKETHDRMAMAHQTPGTQCWRYMGDTMLRNLLFTQPQHQNIHGKVFGGLLMRNAYELAFSTAWSFAGAKPLFAGLETINFRAPVELGTLVHFAARVEYTEHNVELPSMHAAEAGLKGDMLVVAVNATTAHPEDGVRRLTNDFVFAFQFKQPIPTVYPASYEDALAWVDRGEALEHRLSTVRPHTPQFQ